MEKLILFGVFSIVIIIISWKTLLKTSSHGFYRFFSWECIIWLAVNNYKYWFVNPFSFKQIISWLLLLGSLYPLISGILLLKKAGKSQAERNDKALFKFEKTTELIESGIFKYIRHPLYSSLLLLTWGIYFKHTNLQLTVISIASTIFLYYTAKCDEKECLKYFKEKYSEYKKRTKMFIPCIF